MKSIKVCFLICCFLALVDCSKPYRAIVTEELGNSKLVHRPKTISKDITFDQYFDYILSSNKCKLFGVFDDRIYSASEVIGKKIINKCLSAYVKNLTIEAYRDFFSDLGFSCYDVDTHVECKFLKAHEGGEYHDLLYMIRVPTNGIKGPKAGKVQVQLIVIITKELEIIYKDLSV